MNHARGRLRHEDPFKAVELWSGLVDGRWSLVDRFESDGRRFVVALRNDSPYADPRSLTQAEKQVVQLVSKGSSNKAVSYELGVSESTVGTHVSAAMRKLRVQRRECLVESNDGYEPVCTMQLGEHGLAVARSVEWTHRLPGNITTAEQEVASGILRGLKDAEIAVERRVARRTVANQVRSLFQKLGITSRSELVRRMSTDRAPQAFRRSSPPNAAAT